MPWQLIYTSAPRGLLSGQSGFCTVARSGELREALAQRLEQISSYNYLRVAEAATANRNPTVCAFRILDLRGSKYHVLTRIQPCGLDFTARTNHLAHHLVFQAGELAQVPSPAAILRYWNGWLASWQGEPRVLQDPALDNFGVAAKSCLPAQTWLRMTGDAGRAAGLLESECIRGCYLVCPPGSEQQVLEMFCETLQLLNLNGQYALRPWRHPFTTFLQAEDNPADFQWRACQEGTPACQQAAQRTAALIPLRSVRVPNNSLVKVAREGLKPPPSAPAASTHTTLTARRLPPGNGPSGSDLADIGQLRKPLSRPERPAFLDINFSIHSSSLLRIGIFVAVLASLLVMRYVISKKHAAPESIPVVSVPPASLGKDSPDAVSKPNSQPNPAPTAQLDTNQLNGLSKNGPTYVFTVPNLINFNLPIDSIIRFQILTNKFDHMDIRPSDIQLSINTDQWDFTAGAPMTVQGRQKPVLSATNDTGLECSFDYSMNPVMVNTAFSNPPRAFSVRFNFSTPNLGEPFRLLVVNETNPPEALHLSTQWLRTNCEGLVASLQAPLGEILKGHFYLPAKREWQLQPFIKNKGAQQAHYLYQGWPAEDQPPLGEELNFAAVKRPLNARLLSLMETNHGLSQKLEDQTKNAGLDKPVGKILGLTNEHLASFSSWTNVPPTPALFLSYLHHLKMSGAKDHPEMKSWPNLSRDDSETDLADKFANLTVLWSDMVPAARPFLTNGHPNYFSGVWQKIKEIQKARQERRRVQEDIVKLRERLKAIPGTLDDVAYVGLFIIDPPKPALEMIRFEGP